MKQNCIFFLLNETKVVTHVGAVYEISPKQQQRKAVFSKDQINVIRVYLMGN